MIRPALLAVALLAAPAAAVAQTSPAAPAAAPAEPAKERAVLDKTLTALVAGQPNFADMETPLADAVKAQGPAMSGLFAQLGALKSLTYVGGQNGLHRWDGAYANGKLAWIIGLTPEGKIHTLAAQPAG